MDKQFLNNLLNQISVSGCEEEGQNLLKENEKLCGMRFEQMIWEV